MGAAVVTYGNEGHVMLLQHEAHLSASIKISTVLARTQSTIYCSEERFQLSYSDGSTSWSFSVL